MRGRKPELTSDQNAVDRTIAPPSWLSKHAKAEWRRVMPALIERQILTEADLGTLASYCVATSRIREIEALMRVSFDLKLNRAQDASIKTARQLAAELGLTPVSRSRPSVREHDRDNEQDNPLAV